MTGWARKAGFTERSPKGDQTPESDAFGKSLDWAPGERREAKPVKWPRMDTLTLLVMPLAILYWTARIGLVLLDIGLAIVLLVAFPYAIFVVATLIDSFRDFCQNLRGCLKLR